MPWTCRTFKHWIRLCIVTYFLCLLATGNCRSGLLNTCGHIVKLRMYLFITVKRYLRSDVTGNSLHYKHDLKLLKQSKVAKTEMCVAECIVSILYFNRCTYSLQIENKYAYNLQKQTHTPQ